MVVLNPTVAGLCKKCPINIALVSILVPLCPQKKTTQIIDRVESSPGKMTSCFKEAGSRVSGVGSGRPYMIIHNLHVQCQRSRWGSICSPPQEIHGPGRGGSHRALSGVTPPPSDDLHPQNLSILISSRSGVGVEASKSGSRAIWCQGLQGHHRSHRPHLP